MSRKYKREARASILSFMYDYLLIPGFEGFDLANPRGRFGGERFHLACPKLGIGDAILSHTILVRFYISAGGFYTSHRHRKEEGRTIGGFQQGVCTILEGRFIVGV